MSRFHLNIRNSVCVRRDPHGHDFENVLEAMILARTALLALEREHPDFADLWIEIADKSGYIVTTVRLDELPN